MIEEYRTRTHHPEQGTVHDAVMFPSWLHDVTVRRATSYSKGDDENYLEEYQTGIRFRQERDVYIIDFDVRPYLDAEDLRACSRDERNVFLAHQGPLRYELVPELVDQLFSAVQNGMLTHPPRYPRRELRRTLRLDAPSSLRDYRIRGSFSFPTAIVQDRPFVVMLEDIVAQTSLGFRDAEIAITYENRPYQGS
jgi:hypothetical protein